MAVRPYCGVVDQDTGYLCTQPRGHRGEWHSVNIAWGEVIAWPRKPVDERPGVVIAAACLMVLGAFVVVWLLAHVVAWFVR